MRPTDRVLTNDTMILRSLGTLPVCLSNLAQKFRDPYDPHEKYTEICFIPRAAFRAIPRTIAIEMAGCGATKDRLRFSSVMARDELDVLALFSNGIVSILFHPARRLLTRDMKRTWHEVTSAESTGFSKRDDI